MGFVLEVAYHNNVPVQPLRTEADIARFVAELLAADPFHRSASVYAIDETTDADPDHEMIVGVAPERTLGVVRYTGDGGDWASRGDATSPVDVVYTYFGTGHDFPADAEVPLSLVQRAMVELLATGGRRPRCVVWQERQ
ncbi:Imm1 family immunity protein [Actinokineospora sp.]|uniref:Imm1 family immunity protein n=1 Tax=Actinokineospora sp. TaxID=1872133 RepID=UPI004037678C